MHCKLDAETIPIGHTDASFGAIKVAESLGNYADLFRAKIVQKIIKSVVNHKNQRSSMSIPVLKIRVNPYRIRVSEAIPRPFPILVLAQQYKTGQLAEEIGLRAKILQAVYTGFYTFLSQLPGFFQTK